MINMAVRHPNGDCKFFQDFMASWDFIEEEEE